MQVVVVALLTLVRQVLVALEAEAQVVLAVQARAERLIQVAVVVADLMVQQAAQVVLAL